MLCQLLTERCTVQQIRHCHQQARRAKPEPRACPLCAQRVGLSSQAVAVHLKAHHRLAGNLIRIVRECVSAKSVSSAAVVACYVVHPTAQHMV